MFKRRTAIQAIGGCCLAVLIGLLGSPGKAAADDSEDENDAPAVGRRLCEELLCTCGESDCARPPLAHCKCEEAATRRRAILQRVRQLGFGTPEADAATYAAVLREYTRKYGTDATLTAAQSRWRRNWLLGGAIAAVVVGMALVLVRFVQRRLPDRELAAQGKRDRPKKQRRRRRPR